MSVTAPMGLFRFTGTAAQDAYALPQLRGESKTLYSLLRGRAYCMHSCRCPKMSSWSGRYADPTSR
jgi:hypothetical protein